MISVPQLHVISQDKNSPKEHLALQSIDNNVSLLQRLISQSAKTTDIQAIMRELSSVKENINSQMNAFQKMVTRIDGGKQYLEAP